MCDQRLKGPRYVFGGHGCSVMPTGFGSDLEGHPGAIRRPFDVFCQKSVACEGLIRAGYQKRFHSTRADGVAFGNKGMEAVETSLSAEPECAALGCIWVDVGKVREIGIVAGHFGIEHRDGVAARHAVRSGEPGTENEA